MIKCENVLVCSSFYTNVVVKVKTGRNGLDCTTLLRWYKIPCPFIHFVILHIYVNKKILSYMYINKCILIEI